MIFPDPRNHTHPRRHATIVLDLAAAIVGIEYHIGPEPVISVLIRVGNESATGTTVLALVLDLIHAILVPIQRIKISDRLV